MAIDAGKMKRIESRLIPESAHRRILIMRNFENYNTSRVMAVFGVSHATAKRDMRAVREAML